MSVLKVCGYVLLSARDESNRASLVLSSPRMVHIGTTWPRIFDPVSSSASTSSTTFSQTVNAAHDARVNRTTTRVFFVCVHTPRSLLVRADLCQSAFAAGKKVLGFEGERSFLDPFFSLKKSAKKNKTKGEGKLQNTTISRKYLSLSVCVHFYALLTNEPLAQRTVLRTVDVTSSRARAPGDDVRARVHGALWKRDGRVIKSGLCKRQVRLRFKRVENFNFSFHAPDDDAVVADPFRAKWEHP